MDREICSLAALPIGSKGVVLVVQAKANMRRQLLDLGLVPGTVVASVRRSPLGDPTAFSIRGATIALRKTDSSSVFVKPIVD